MSSNLKIAVGTTSPQKIEFLKEVLSELKIESEIIPCDVKSQVPDQPTNSKITKTGSINRAKSALLLTPKADFGLGIEVGYRIDWKGDYFILCWATIISNSKKVSACSHKFKLPDFHQNILKSGQYLGEHVREYLEIYKNPLEQIVGIDIRDRKPYIYSSLRSVLLRYLISA